jgi:hypothetical protein
LRHHQTFDDRQTFFVTRIPLLLDEGRPYKCQAVETSWGAH